MREKGKKISTRERNTIEIIINTITTVEEWKQKQQHKNKINVRYNLMHLQKTKE